MSRNSAGRWEGSEVLESARAVDRAKATPWGALRYAAGAAAVLATATAMVGPTAGVVVASGAINAGAVGVNSGFSRPRLVMAVSLVALATAAFLGSVTASAPPVAVAAIAVLGVLAGLLARAGPAASTVGVQATVGFVTLGRFPGPPSTADARWQSGEPQGNRFVRAEAGLLSFLMLLVGERVHAKGKPTNLQCLIRGNLD